MEDFQKLGELIEDRWRRENYSEQLFPEIAATALAESDLPSRVDPWEIIRWVQTQRSLPEQKDVEGRFGDPPITLFVGPRFYIDVYYWLDGTTSIHQHSFTGAFQVLLGSSIHSHYQFKAYRVLNEHFSVGELSLKEVRLLKVGDIMHILPGSQYIHSLFHLDRPSATITVRTENTPSAAVQYDYRKPYFALNPFFRNVTMAKKLQTVNLLLGMKHKDTDAMLADMIASSDFHTTYFVLLAAAQHMKGSQIDELFGLSTGNDRFNALVEKARTVHGELVDKFVAVQAQQERQFSIVARRGSITGDEHRFFLALLLNVPSQEKVLELVKTRFPEVDPVEKILDWVEELSQTRVLGSKESNALGIEGFDAGYVLVLEGLLKGASPQKLSEELKSDSDSAADTANKVQVAIQNLRSSPLFKSMLS